MDRKESDPTRNPNSNELSLEERQRLIEKSARLTQEFAALAAKPERTKEEDEKMAEIAGEIEEINEILYRNFKR